MNDLAQARCRSEDDISAGLLNSTQTIEWAGPPLPAARHAELAARMDREHFNAVQQSVFGLIRCRVQPDRVVCSVFGLIPLLKFGAPVTSVERDGVSRIWGVTGGLLARRGSLYGNLTFVWSQREQPDHSWVHCLSSSVQGYPSRFLRVKDDFLMRSLLRHVAAWYASYHGKVTCRFLRRLARWVNDAAREDTA
jgi:hypothetical protein